METTELRVQFLTIFSEVLKEITDNFVEGDEITANFKRKLIDQLNKRLSSEFDETLRDRILGLLEDEEIMTRLINSVFGVNSQLSLFIPE